MQDPNCLLILGRNYIEIRSCLIFARIKLFLFLICKSKRKCKKEERKKCFFYLRCCRKNCFLPQNYKILPQVRSCTNNKPDLSNKEENFKLFKLLASGFYPCLCEISKTFPCSFKTLCTYLKRLSAQNFCRK